MSDSFRTMQAVSDLIHHVKPLLAQHLAAVAEASGLTLRETGEAFAQLRDDGFRFQHDETLPLLLGLEQLAITQAKGFELAVVVLLADVLQTGKCPASLANVWAWAVSQLSNWPDTLRAAVANGLARANELGMIKLDDPPHRSECQTREASTISGFLLQIVRSLKRHELYSIACADYRTDVEQHSASLLDLIGKRDGIFPEGETWFPAEVVELTSYVPTAPGYEGCTAILLLNALKHGDLMDWFGFRWKQQGASYCALRSSTRGPILAGIRHIYESDPNFLTFGKVDLGSHLGEGAIIPVVDDL